MDHDQNAPAPRGAAIARRYRSGEERWDLAEMGRSMLRPYKGGGERRPPRKAAATKSNSRDEGPSLQTGEERWDLAEMGRSMLRPYKGGAEKRKATASEGGRYGSGEER